MKFEVIDNRASKRQRILLTVEIEVGGERRRAHLLNISETGAKLDADDVPEDGSPIVLRRDPIAAAGTVSWIIDHRFGVQFDKPLAADAVAELAALLSPQH